MNCDNCAAEITQDDNGTFSHLWGPYCTRSFHDTAKATPIVRKRYTVIMNDGIGPGRIEPEKPCNGNQANGLTEAKAMFREWLTSSGNDYYRAEGYDQPNAEIILTEHWDGISYGDYPWTCLLVRGIHGGVNVESV